MKTFTEIESEIIFKTEIETELRGLFPLTEEETEILIKPEILIAILLEDSRL